MATVRYQAGSAASTFRGTADGFEVVVDRGENGKPRSVDLLLLGHGSCTMSTLDHYVRRKGLPIEQVGVEVSADLNEKLNLYENLRVVLALGDAFSPTDRAAVVQVARTCRIHKTFASSPRIDVSIAASAPEPAG
jgi:uncharacterized OsmC-like protein